MNFLKKHRVSMLLIYIVIIGCFLRLYNLNWDDGHFLHPDERLYVNASNISFPHSIQEFLSPDSPLNPNMFYYGSFPLYLYSFIYTYIFSFDSFLLTSRFISALFSISTIPILFLIGRKLFNSKTGLFTAFVFTFAPGSIQHAHFNTTESILVFLLSFILFLSLHIVKNKKGYLFLLIGTLIGISYGTKIIGLTFLLIPFISFYILLKEKLSIKKFILFGFLLLISGVITGLISAPYQIIDMKQFFQEQEYMQGVTYGKYKPPFIIIYENTVAYLYPLIKILPFTFGFVAFPLSLIGGFLLLRELTKHFKTKTILLIIILFPVLYFLWAGAWYAKFSRYYLLLFPFFAVWTGYYLSKLNKYVLLLLLCLIGINGLLFLNVYTKLHTRIAASAWIYNTIPSNSTIASEHWDDNLPLPLQNSNTGSYRSLQLPVYDTDSLAKIKSLSQTLADSDYVIISSRRVYYSILKNSTIYPYTSKFYRLLFADTLGYKLDKSFTNYPYFINDDFADETFQSYDHPPVLIFKNERKYDASKIEAFINS